MTKNNLTTHLKWLLKQGPSLYPSFIPSVHDSRKDIGVPSVPQAQLGLDQPGASSGLGAESDLERIPGTFTNDTGTDDADASIDDTDMARLLIAPQSTSKPRLLSSSKKSAETRKTGDGVAPEASPSEQRKSKHPDRVTGRAAYSGLWHNYRELTVEDTQHGLSPPSHKIKDPTTTPSRSKDVFDFDSPIFDVDAIDLTGEYELPAAPSSGTLEGFGSPRQLHNGNDAPISESAKRGKKRKSDEYKSDLLSPRRHAPKVRSPRVSSKPTTTKEIDLVEPPPASPTVSAKNPPEWQLPTGRRDELESRVIADSDDDDDDDLFVGWQDDDPVTDDVVPNTDRLNGHATNEPPNRPETTSFSGHEPDIRNDPAPVNKGPLQNHVSSAIYPSPFPSSSQAKPDEAIFKLLAISQDSLCEMVKEFRNTLTKNSEIVFQRAMEGIPALDLITVNKTLKDRIEAIEELKVEIAAYKACESKKNDLKQAIMQVILQGDDPSSMNELAESRAVSTELGQREETMRGLLARADIPNIRPECSAAETTSSPTRTPPVNKPSKPQTSKPAAKPILDSTADDGPGYFGYDEPMSEVEGTFMRNMGSPAPPAEEGDVDDFGLGTDDEDILEVAGSFADNQGPRQSEREPRNRSVFGEMSGNSQRVPSGETSASAFRLPSPEKSPVRTALWNQHPWSMDVKNVLKDRFQLRGFRMNQLEAIDATLGGKDTFVLMPTGGGKSLCYQLPSVVSSGSTSGVTIVISPLLSLMQDQVEHLQRLKIKALLLNGKTKQEERQWIMSTLSGPRAEEHIQLLYITPEMLSMSQALTQTLQRLHRRKGLSRIVVDEAHCVSQWGHDFRPEYKELGEIRNHLPGIPMMALTATATENVKVDVIHNLKMDGCQVFTQSFNRPNLTYEVLPKSKGSTLLTDIANVIKNYRNQSGIVYCLSRKTCEKVAEALSDKFGVKAAFYHAGMPTAEKTEVQQRWQSGRYNVIVATIAFGMGIDKPDVRYVIHHSIPKSLEGYYQETGRAGRDGKRSGCYLYYSYKDTATLKHMIDSGDGNGEQKNRQHAMLRNVVQYCENKSDCRRVQILAYFNEYFRREQCNSSCDNCKSDSVFETHDFTEYAGSAVKLVRHFQDVLDEQVTLSYCMNVFRGKVKSFRSASHKKIPWYGAGSALELGEAERLFQHLLNEGAFREENVVNARRFATQYLKIGRRAAEFESGRRKLKLQVRLSPRKGTSRTNSGNNDDYPQSTNVSSPIQAVNQRRLAGNRQRGGDSDAESEDSDGFEKVRVAGKSRQDRKRTIGPPITDDGDFSRLDPLHQAVADDFMYYAKQYCQSVMLERNLRNQPFTDGILRQIAIQFPKDMKELVRMPGIDPDKVSRYGSHLLKLVKDTERRLVELKHEGEDANGVVPDPNHTNVINLDDDDDKNNNIDSDDEFGGDDIFTGQTSPLFDIDNSETISSRYFTKQPAVSDDHPGTGRKTRKPATSKRPRRNPSSSGSKGKASKPRARKTTASTSNGSSRSSAPRKAPKAKSSSASIPMMPV